MPQVAEEAGFHSLRRFNEVMQAVFKRTPSELRRRGGADGPSLTLRLAYRPPYDWAALVGFLGARAIPGVEMVDAGAYRRTFESGRMEVRPDRGNALSLTLTLSRRDPGQALEIAGRVRRMFDLDADPLEIGATLAADPLLGPSVRARPGLRLPGTWDPFETCVRAILGQQVSVRAATTLGGRLVGEFGALIPGAGSGLTHLFPAPERLASAPLERIGLTRARAESIRCVARSAQVLRERPESLDGLIDRLCSLPGVGPWTAHYLAMRAFGEADAFPSGDLVLRKASRELSSAALDRPSALSSSPPARAVCAPCLCAAGCRTSRLPRARASRGRRSPAPSKHISLGTCARSTRSTWTRRAPHSSGGSGPRCAPSPPAPPGPTPSWRGPSASPPLRAPWAPRTAGTRSRWFCLVTG